MSYCVIAVFFVLSLHSVFFIWSIKLFNFVVLICHKVGMYSCSDVMIEMNFLSLLFCMELYTITLKMSIYNTIKVSSANVQGIRDLKKQIDVLTYLLKDANIVCLQDTHLTSADMHSLRTTFPECEIFIEGNKTNSRGILILLKKL